MERLKAFNSKKNVGHNSAFFFVKFMKCTLFFCWFSFFFLVLFCFFYGFLTCRTSAPCWRLGSGCPWSQLLCRAGWRGNPLDCLLYGPSLAPSLRFHWDCPCRTILTSRLQEDDGGAVQNGRFKPDSAPAAALAYLRHKREGGSWNGHDSLRTSSCTGPCFCRWIQ